MNPTEIQQQAIQARMAHIMGAENYDRLFAAVMFSEVADSILYAFAPGLAAISTNGLRFSYRSSPARLPACRFQVQPAEAAAAGRPRLAGLAPEQVKHGAGER